MTNVTDAISINHNWLNAANAALALERLSAYLSALRATLDAADKADKDLCMMLLRRRAGVCVCVCVCVYRLLND